MAPSPPPERRIARIGLVVNPIAGMGGAVALRGTDGRASEARERGAVPVSGDRAVRFLGRLSRDVHVVTCSGAMGADACTVAARSFDVVLDVPLGSSREDTLAAVRAFAARGVDLVVFVGGDGTARDVAEVAGPGLVALGVPSGVKMNSAVFAATPEEAALVVERFLADDARESEVAEVVEVDEAALRRGELAPVVLASLRVPAAPGLPGSKAEPGGTVEGVVEAIEALAAPGETLVLGPGSTLFEAKQSLVRDGTLLGVDVIVVGPHGGCTLAIADATAAQLADVPDTALLVVTPIGGQGFVLGRGNQQVTPDLFRRLGWSNLVVVATPQKLAGLDALRVDTGDAVLDASAPAHLPVLTGPGFRRLVPVRTA